MLAIPRYTRSLDAVWEGTNNGEFCCREVFSDYSYHHRAKVSITRPDTEGQEHSVFTGTSVDHPAEALVLACLRAVGVGEEELA